MIFKGAHWERNQPVPVRGFKPFCYRALNICSKIRGGAKNNQCHGTVALARWAPLHFTKYAFGVMSLVTFLEDPPPLKWVTSFMDGPLL